ncbi:hypothetical protein RIF29_17918 [Crotalaria pallida]|uniref:Uncharacterized protein n=1 Tax=Crotalaria pallida TaxID=3830 RepID=A0AAN9IEZ7_CROPI
MEEENTETQSSSSIPTFLMRQDSASSVVTHGAVHKSLHVLRRSRRLWRRDGSSRELMKVQHHQHQHQHQIIKEVVVNEENNNNGGSCVEKEEEEDDDREEIEEKIHALQKIVPNGESLGVDKLFDETAEYIMALQSQVKALRTLTGFFEKLEKEKTKFGG